MSLKRNGARLMLVSPDAGAAGGQLSSLSSHYVLILRVAE